MNNKQVAKGNCQEAPSTANQYHDIYVTHLNFILLR